MTKVTEFAQETKREIAKVTWPTRRETMMTTVLIIIMASAFGVFFLGVDSLLGYAIGRILNMNG
jgi:preprotein translocase subunit SecE